MPDKDTKIKHNNSWEGESHHKSKGIREEWEKLSVHTQGPYSVNKILLGYDSRVIIVENGVCLGFVHKMELFTTKFSELGKAYFAQRCSRSSFLWPKGERNKRRMGH